MLSEPIPVVAVTRFQTGFAQPLSQTVEDTVINNQASHGRMTDIYFTDRRVNQELIRSLGGLVHEKVHAEAS